MDNKEKPEEGVVVSVTKGHSSALSKFKNAKLLVLVIVLVVLVAAAVIVQANQAAFVIDGKKYSKSSVSAMAKYVSDENPRYTKAAAAKSIFNLYKTQVAAEKAGIIPNNSEIQAADKTLKFSNADSGAGKKYKDLVAYNAAIGNSYDRYKAGNYKGTYFAFDFSEYILPMAAGEQPLAHYEDQKVIAQDGQYAYDKAQVVYIEVKKNSKSISDLSKEIMGDQTDGFRGTVYSFDPSKGDLSSQIFYPEVYKYITSQTKPGLSSVKTGQVETSFHPGPKDYANGYYYFVKLDSAGKVVNDPSGVINKEKGNLKATYYGV